MILRIARMYRSSFSGLSRETWLLSIVMLINRASTMVVPFMSMYITQSMHRSIADAGLIITLWGIGAVLGSTTAGFFIDRIGFRTVQIGTSLSGGLLFILFGQIDHFTVLCFLALLVSFVAEAFRPANSTAVATYSTRENLTRSYSLNRLATNLGFGVGISLGGVLAAASYHLLFWVEGLVYILVGILIFILLPSRAANEPRDSVTTAEPGILPWKDPFVVRFMVLVTIYTTCFILLFRLVAVYWKEELHIDESLIGLFLGLNGILIALFEMVLVRHWESRNRNMYYIIAGVLCTAMGYLFLIMPGLSSYLAALGMVLFITFGEMMAMPFLNSVIMRRAGERNRGKYAAAYAMAWSIAQITGPGGGALVAQRWGYPALWIISIALCLACAAGFGWLAQQQKRFAGGRTA